MKSPHPTTGIRRTGTQQSQNVSPVFKGGPRGPGCTTTHCSRLPMIPQPKWQPERRADSGVRRCWSIQWWPKLWPLGKPSISLGFLRGTPWTKPRDHDPREMTCIPYRVSPGECSLVDCLLSCGMVFPIVAGHLHETLSFEDDAVSKIHPYEPTIMDTVSIIAYEQCLYHWSLVI